MDNIRIYASIGYFLFLVVVGGYLVIYVVVGVTYEYAIIGNLIVSIIVESISKVHATVRSCFTISERLMAYLFFSNLRGKIYYEMQIFTLEGEFKP